MHIMIVACPSPAFTFRLLLISHAIITVFACICCILTLQGLFHVKMKANTCTVCEIGLSTEEEDDGENGGGGG